MMLASKVIKRNSKIIISLCKSKSATHFMLVSVFIALTLEIKKVKDSSSTVMNESVFDYEFFFG